jgi:hypothetical protein
LPKELQTGGKDDFSKSPDRYLFAAVSSLGGSSAAVEVAMQSDMSSGAVIGALAGLFSTILAAMLIITYHMRPGEHSSRKH